MQARLTKAGFDTGGTDGRVGNDTMKAVEGLSDQNGPVACRRLRRAEGAGAVKAGRLAASRSSNDSPAPDPAPRRRARATARARCPATGRPRAIPPHAAAGRDCSTNALPSFWPIERNAMPLTMAPSPDLNRTPQMRLPDFVGIDQLMRRQRHDRFGIAAAEGPSAIERRYQFRRHRTRADRAVDEELVDMARLRHLVRQRAFHIGAEFRQASLRSVTPAAMACPPPFISRPSFTA